MIEQQLAITEGQLMQLEEMVRTTSHEALPAKDMTCAGVDIGDPSGGDAGEGG
jgi:hypothetical protein